MKKGFKIAIITIFCAASYGAGLKHGEHDADYKYSSIIDEMSLDKQLLFTAYVERTQELVDELDSVKGQTTKPRE